MLSLAKKNPAWRSRRLLWQPPGRKRVGRWNLFGMARRSNGLRSDRRSGRAERAFLFVEAYLRNVSVVIHRKGSYFISTLQFFLQDGMSGLGFRERSDVPWQVMAYSFAESLCYLVIINN